MNILKNIEIKKLFDTAYIFEKTPASLSNYLYLAILFGFLIILSVIFWYGYGRLKKKQPLWRKIQMRVFNICFYTGLAGLFLIFFRWQGVAYLGSRFFLLSLLAVFIIWAMFIIYFRVLVFPKELAKFEEQEKFEKYLPSPRLRQTSLPRRATAGLPRKDKK